MRMVLWMRGVALPVLAAAVVAVPAAGQQAERFSITGSTAVVHNLAGEITVAAGTGSAVVVEVTRRGADASRLRVARDGNAVRVAFPGDRVVYEPMDPRSRSSFSVRQDGSLGGGMVAYLLPIASVLAPPGIAVVVDLRDPVAFQRGIEGVLKVLEEESSGEFAVRNKP